jgi:hypothetical protein
MIGGINVSNNFYLARDTYFSYRGNAAILMHVSKDKYHFLDESAARLLSDLSNAKYSETLQSHPDLADLVTKGVLVTDSSKGKQIKATEYSSPTETFCRPIGEPPVRITVTDALNFIWAAATADTQLRFRSTDQIVARIERRKRRPLVSHTPDLQSARKLTAKFKLLRPIYPVDFLCLFDSLALLQFLARYCLFPSWVFAVRLEPFTAHCWVEQAGILFNETIDKAASYTPVMIV